MTIRVSELKEGNIFEKSGIDFIVEKITDLEIIYYQFKRQTYKYKYMKYSFGRRSRQFINKKA